MSYCYFSSCLVWIRLVWPGLCDPVLTYLTFLFFLIQSKLSEWPIIFWFALLGLVLHSFLFLIFPDELACLVWSRLICCFLQWSIIDDFVRTNLGSFVYFIAIRSGPLDLFYTILNFLIWPAFWLITPTNIWADLFWIDIIYLVQPFLI